MAVKENPLVLLICAKRDYANVAYEFQESLRSVGIDAFAYAGGLISTRSKGAEIFKAEKISRENYFLPGGNSPEFMRKIKESNIIIYMHSKYIDLGLSKEKMKDKTMAVFHGGTFYRVRSKTLNGIFNPIVDISLIQTYELFGKGAKNEQWILPPVDTESLKPKFHPPKKRRVISHYPSYSKYKGTSVINSVMKDLGNSKLSNELYYHFSSEKISWEKNIERMRDCDIYIESLSQGDNECSNKHDWSVTALEAASLGKIVVTNFGFGEELYREVYGKHTLQVANSAKQLKEVLSKLLTMNNVEFQKLKYKTREWVESCHSRKAIGKRLKDIFNI